MAQEEVLDTGPGPDKSGSPPTKTDTEAAPRRSGRVRKRVALPDSNPGPPPKPAATSTSAATNRRNPKRKAAPEVFDVPEHLLEASLGPWDEGEQAEWPSWVEVESDPALFNGILRQLGAKAVRIEEVFSMDDDSLLQLPAPVYGLVFLFQYVEEESTETDEPPDGLWFANQTTDNACATIAMLNILMNAQGLPLGEKLRRLKEMSADLSPPLRGNLITHSSWIRVAHNSFARRLDLLDAALRLQNNVEERKKKRARSSKSRAKKQKNTTQAAYHFIAYVPIGNTVWQLDGLERGPVRIGEFAPGERWTSAARPVIEARMMQYETEQLSFSLLAMCGDHLGAIRKELAVNIRCLQVLVARWSGSSEWADLETDEPGLLDGKDSVMLSRYGLEMEDIEILSHGSSELAEIQEKECGPTSEAPDAKSMRQKLHRAQKQILSRYTAHPESTDDEVVGVLGRTKDHTPAIHAWVAKLAMHGVLAHLHQETQFQIS